MSKELESLKRLYEHLDGEDLAGDDYYINDANKDLAIIKTALKNYELVMPIIDELCELAKTNDIDEMIAYFETTLKALEIIKEKNVDTSDIFATVNYSDYKRMCDEWKEPLTQEEYDLLKEELL